MTLRSWNALSLLALSTFDFFYPRRHSVPSQRRDLASAFRPSACGPSAARSQPCAPEACVCSRRGTFLSLLAGPYRAVGSCRLVRRGPSSMRPGHSSLTSAHLFYDPLKARM